MSKRVLGFWGKVLALLGSAVLLVPLPFLLSYYPRHILIMSMIYIVLVASLNIVTGYAGQMSLGQGGFFAVGAYVSALLTTRLGVSFWWAILLAALSTAACGILVGLPSFRIRGIYLAILTLMFTFIVSALILNLRELTGGASGMLDIPRPRIGDLVLTRNEYYYYIVLAFVLFTVGSVYYLARSPLGRALRAIREDETAASLLGLSTIRYKLFAFAASAFYAGIGGSLYAHYAGLISPEAYPPTLSITILIMALIGGLGRIDGAILGAIVVYSLPEVLRFAQTYWNLIFGLIIVLIILFLPEGLVSIPLRVRFLWNRIRTRGSTGSEREMVAPRMSEAPEGDRNAS